LRLRAEFIRAHFQSQPKWQPEIVSDRMRVTDAVLVPAAVLVPLVVSANGELSLLLTQRTENLKKHSGQIAFPGGKVDPEDLDAIDAALREAFEEVGLERQLFEVLGTMPVYETGTGFAITPVVALIREGFSMTLSEQEVAEAFTVPLSFLMNPRFHERRSFEWENRSREFYAMPYAGIRQTEQGPQPAEYFIWGATAAMIRNLYRFLIA
jgi:8-oxo-dGTP pyrophosphatase MutT (NUDIX family)